MRWSAYSSRISMMMVVVLVLLLAVLATLQYRWIAQLSEAERSRLQTSLHRATMNLCEDFDREITSAFAAFNIEKPADEEDLSRLLGERLQQWRSTAAWPELVKDLTIIRSQAANEVSPVCFDETSQTLLRCEWDDGLLPIRNKLRNPERGRPDIEPILPGLILVIQEPRSPGADFLFKRPLRDHLIVRFNLGFITRTLLPHLIETHLGNTGDLAYTLRVSPVGKPEHIIFQTGFLSPAGAVKPDATNLFFGLRPFADGANPTANNPITKRRPPPRAERPRRNPPREQNPPGPPPRAEEGSWVLEVRHPAGSLEDVVTSARRRNMAISLFTLMMLGATAILMMLSTRRAQFLARQQMDFVAAISHELRTPLTAIRSAGQNLADGIIAEPAKVRSYGLLIEREGRRLTEMIGRVLTYAGIRSGQQSFRMGLVRLPEVVEAALADCRWTLDEKNFEVDAAIPPELPPVQGDAGALRLVLANLIDNAIKYGASGRWLGIHGGYDPANGPGEVWISVSDHGPGIARKERQRLFEPFRRGKDAALGTVPGSGLGLAVVRGVIEGHGGRIEVSSGTGATFTVRLPAERPEPDQKEKQ